METSEGDESGLNRMRESEIKKTNELISMFDPSNSSLDGVPDSRRCVAVRSDEPSSHLSNSRSDRLKLRDRKLNSLQRVGDGSDSSAGLDGRN